MGGRADNNWGERREDVCYPWHQNSYVIAGPLDDVSHKHLQQRIITVVKVQQGLATAHAKLLTHALGLLNHALGAHRPNKHSETPSSLLRPIKLWGIVPTPLHSQDSRVKRRERFASVERGDITLILSWLMEYTSRASTRAGGQPKKPQTRPSTREHRQHVATLARCQWQHAVFSRNRARPATR